MYEIIKIYHQNKLSIECYKRTNFPYIMWISWSKSLSFRSHNSPNCYEIWNDLLL